MPPKKKRKASPAGQSERTVRARTDDVESPTAHELGQPYPAEGADVKTVIYANAKAGTVFMDEKDAVVIKRSEHLTTLGIEGNGVFAKTFIPKGAVFGWYSGLSFSSLPRAAWAKHPLRDNPYNMMVHCLHEEECG